MAQEPAHAQVLHGLLGHGRQGAELHMQQPSAYGFSGCVEGGEAAGAAAAPSFRELAEAARRRGQTALGYRCADGRIALVPNPDVRVRLEAGVRVIALAERVTDAAERGEQVLGAQAVERHR